MEILKEFKKELNTQYENALSKLSEDAAKNLKHAKYSVFYTNPKYTLKKGDIYFLGLNPAVPEGGRNEPQDVTFTNEERMRCSYFPEDESWGKSTYHQYRIQDALKTSLEALGLNPSEDNLRKVFSSNLYFFSSKDTKSLFQYDVKQDFYLNWHKRFIQIVLPSIIISNGNGNHSAFNHIKKIFDSGSITDNKSKSYYRGFSFKSYTGSIDGRKILVIGLPHLSRYALENKRTPNDEFNVLMKRTIEEFVSSQEK